MSTELHPLEKLLRKRIAIIDGAMGTTIRTYGMTEADIRGERFKDAKKDLLNNGDIFSLTQPKMICDIHRRFLEAGADIIETNTFGATSIAQSEFFVDDPREHGGRKDPAFYQKIIDDKFLERPRVGDQRAVRAPVPRVGGPRRERRRQAALRRGRHRAAHGVALQLARRRRRGLPRRHVRSGEGRLRAADPRAHRGRRRTCCSSRRSSIRSTPRRRSSRSRRCSTQDGKRLPIMISAAVGRGGETMISAQTGEAFWNAVKHVKPLSIGLNCSLGPDLMYPFLAELSEKSNAAISCYPNAGLPNPLSPTGFDLEPADMGRYLGEFAQGGLINIAGGCCGNTPEHIAAIAKALDGRHPRELRRADERDVVAIPTTASSAPLRLSGSQPFTQQIGVYMMIGERTNVAGSPKFAKLDQGRQIRRGRQRRAPAGRERRERHRHLHGRRDDRRRRRDDALPPAPRRASPRSRRCPFMVDSSKWEVIEAGLKCLQGKGIVNSISLKEGEEQVPRERADDPALRRGGRRHGLRRARARPRPTRRRSASASAPIASSSTRSASRPRTSSSIRTSSPSPPASRSTTTTPSISSRPRAGSRRTCRTPR